jgi:hypothetical protein
MGEYLAMGEHAPLVNRLRNGDSMSNYDERLRIEAADKIERLSVELRHCINELRSGTSRPPHRIRRAALAEKVLHKKEPSQ